MKNTLSIVAFGGILALASCASGPTPEEQAAAEQARLDSLKAVEQFRLDSMAQVAAEAEAAAYAAGQAEAEAAAAATAPKGGSTAPATKPVVEEKKEEPNKERPGAVSTGTTGTEKADPKKSRPGAVKTN